MIKEKIYERLEKGQQLGIEKFIEKDHKGRLLLLQIVFRIS